MSTLHVEDTPTTIDPLRELISTAGAPPSGASPEAGPEFGQESGLESGLGRTNNLVTIRQESRSSLLLQQMGGEIDSETIVLADTAPLLASGETEYLARFVDSAIVVIQSGLTTRAQLREVARTLQRLELAAVRFVLNRVSIEKADPSFRQSLRAVSVWNRKTGRAGAVSPEVDLPANRVAIPLRSHLP